MKVKTTIKIGDHEEIMTEEQSRMFGGNEAGFEQLLQAKGALKMLTDMMDASDPTQAGKRIEVITEFDDGQYVVIGRKPKEIDDGR